MKKTKHTEEKIIRAVKQLEAGRSAKDVARKLLNYGWRGFRFERGTVRLSAVRTRDSDGVAAELDT